MATLFDKDDTQAICDSQNSDRVIKFIPKNSFTSEVQQLMQNGSINGVYYNEAGEIVAEDIWGDVHVAISDVVEKTVSDAVGHFTSLYAEEIASNEVTEDSIYEWWTQTRDQYEGLEYDEVEAAILAKI